MRHPILIIFIFLYTFLSAEGQKTNSYKYVYKVQLDEPKAVGSIAVYKLQNQEALKTITGIVINDKSEPIPFLTIILKSKDKKIYTTTNNIGQFEINAIPSTYELIIAGVGYAEMSQTLAIENKMGYTLRIKLAQQSLTWYNIHSKKELTKGEIDQIKTCVETNEGNPTKCERKNEYYITIEI